MFEHSVKVPRHFKIASNIFKKVSTEGGSVKTLLYDDKLKHFRTNVLYALITETIKHAGDIDRIFESSGILVNEPRLDPWLAKVLTAELLFGKKTLPGKSKPEQTILTYKEQFEKFTTRNPDEVKSKVVPRPRYVRINTNLLTTSDAIRAFQDEGYKFIRCTSGSYDDYLKQIQSLTEYDFSQDYHVKTVFVFAPGTKLHEHDLYLSNQIILQDKATALAVHLLSPPPGSVVLDMCAAPGMKTTQLAAFLRNQGKIYAVERNEKRYATLCDFVKSTDSKCVETLHKDALEIRRGDFDDVEYILLDPSCSGSGMELCVHNYIEETRLAKLTSLQEKFLKHAMNAFPKAKRIVYSTCSLYPEENERVVTNVVKTSRAKWRVQDVKELLKGQWNNFGSGMYGSMGTRCLYAKPESDMTTGFFLAVLDREPKDNDKNQNEKESLYVEVKNKKEHEINDKDSCNVVDTETTSTLAHNETDVKIKKKKKKKEKHCSDITERSPELPEIDHENLKESLDVEVINKKEHEINDKDSCNVVVDTETTSTQAHNETDVKIKKKKKKKEKHYSDITESLPELPEIDHENFKESLDVEVINKKEHEINDKDSCNVVVDTETTSTQAHNETDVMIKKKKKKKEKHCSDITESLPELPEIDHENFKESLDVEVINKKEHEMNDKDSCNVVVDTEITSTQAHNETDVKIKKKKEKHCSNITESSPENPEIDLENLTENNVKIKEKKKRKKSKLLDDNNLAAVNDVPNIDELQGDGAEEISLKKKKKKRNKNKDEKSITLDNSVNNALKDKSADTTIESKKKNKKKHSQQDIESVDDLPKKKKQKKE